MKKQIFWSLIALFIVGCSSNQISIPSNTKIESETKTLDTNSVVSLSYKKKFTKKEQEECALINAELALSEKLGKTGETVNEMKISRKSNSEEYDISIPCMSKEDLYLIKNVKLIYEENNNSYEIKTWRISGSDILYIWTRKL